MILHLNRFRGNPDYFAGGRAVLRVLDKEKRQEHCAKVGSHLLPPSDKLQEKHVLMGDVRGQGLVLVVELVKDHNTKAELAEALRE
eukprot:gene3328-13359_t